MKKILLTLAVTALLTGCAIHQNNPLVDDDKPEIAKVMMQKEFDTIPEPASGKPVSVAV